MSSYTGLCTVCGHIQQRRRPHSADGPCAECGDLQHVPWNLDDTVTVTLSKDELGLLTFWSSRHAEYLDANPRPHAPKVTSSAAKVLSFTLDRLALQTDMALTPSHRTADMDQEDAGAGR